MIRITDDKCPKCKNVMERRPDQFYYREKFFHGLVCVTCNSLWDDPTDSFAEHMGIPLENP